MDRVILEIFSDTTITGTRRRLATSPQYPGRQFSWIPPEKRRVIAAHYCSVGHEATRDYYTDKRGDLKLCRVHEVLEDETRV
jgi:hypothetical protein